MDRCAALVLAVRSISCRRSGDEDNGWWKVLNTAAALAQGNSDLYTELALKERHDLRTDTRVIEAVKSWWRCVNAPYGKFSSFVFGPASCSIKLLVTVARVNPLIGKRMHMIAELASCSLHVQMAPKGRRGRCGE